MTTIAQDRPIDLGIHIEADEASIEAVWTVPLRPRGTILVINGAGNSRLSCRNREVSRNLQDAGFATLVVDLLAREEEREDALTGSLRMDIDFLAQRINAATRWIRAETEMAHFPVGYMASGAASAAALVAASRNPLDIAAIVSHGGRADLAGIRLHKVDSPTLLIVGGADPQGFEFNRWALRRLNCEKRIVVIPKATHRFGEPGALHAATRIAREWFERFMKRPHQLATRRSIFVMNFSERNSGRASM